MPKLTPQGTLKQAAEAWAKLAHVLMIDYLRGWNNATEENVRLAEEALQKADALDRSVALAYVAKAKILEVKEGNLKGEIDALNEALKFDRNLADAYAHQANAHILLGEAEKAPELLTKAIQFSQGDPELGLCYWFMGRAYFHKAATPGISLEDAAKDYDTAIHWLKKSTDERPTTWFTWTHLISAYAWRNQLGKDEAQKAVKKYRDEFKEKWPLEKINDYYKQVKYQGAYPQLQAALKNHIKGLEIALK